MINLDEDKLEDIIFHISENEQVGKDIFYLDDAMLEVTGMLVKTPVQPISSEATPQWLISSVDKKHSLVPVSIPIKDIVSKYVQKTHKAMKVKSTT